MLSSQHTAFGSTSSGQERLSTHQLSSVSSISINPISALKITKHMSSATNKKFNPIVWAYHTKKRDLTSLKQSAVEERQKLQGEVSRLQADIKDLTKIIEDEVSFGDSSSTSS